MSDPGSEQDALAQTGAAMIRRLKAQNVAIDCLAEIIFGKGLRVPVWGRAKVALETLGITEAPPTRTDAER